MTEAYLERVNALLTAEERERLQAAKVLVCGVGGVGSFVCEALARSGIGKLVIADFDRIEASNLNRQLLSTKENIGEKKVTALRKRLESVAEATVEVLDIRIDEAFKLDPTFTYVIDCIDDIPAKFALVLECARQGVPYIAALGSARRLSPVGLKATVLAKTNNDPLARAFRRYVRKNNYQAAIPVVYFDAPCLECSQELASAIFPCGSMGLYLAYLVFDAIIKK